MKELFITSLEDLEELDIRYYLEDCGMSGKYYGWHWFQDDAADVSVYLKIEEKC